MQKTLQFEEPIIIAGPCALEKYAMMNVIAKHLTSKGIKILRAGVFKPRTSPHDFQGLGLDGLSILNQIKKRYNVQIVSEIVDIRHIDDMCGVVDILQVGSRNMYNYELLKELGKIKFPILLKRGISATINEFINAAQYIIKNGNTEIILCERGVRSFDNATRNTLDLSCVPIIKKELNLPIITDISHSLGRKDIAIPMAKAALAAGADGIMVEVHNNPTQALSDNEQQMSLQEFDTFYREIKHFIRIL